MSKKILAALSALLLLMVGSMFATSVNGATLTGSALSVRDSGASGTPIVRSVRRDNVISESFAAAEHETLELLLTDGSSVTLAAAAKVKVNSYTYDVTTKVGELSLMVEEGSVRVIGGALNNTTSIDIEFRGGQAKMDNGVSMVTADRDGTTVRLALGKSLAVVSALGNRELNRPGQSLHIGLDGSLSAPQLTRTSDAQSLSAMFNPGLLTGVVPVFKTEAAGESAGVSSSRLGLALDSQAYRDASHQLPEPALAANVQAVNCTNCGSLSGFGLQGTGIGSIDSSGSTGTTYAPGWVWTGASGSGASIAFDQPGLTQLLKANSGAVNLPVVVPQLSIVFGTANVNTYDGSTVDLATNLWLAPHIGTFDNPLPWPINPAQAVANTDPLTYVGNMFPCGLTGCGAGSNISASYSFDVSAATSGLMLNQAKDGVVQAIAATTANLCSSASNCTFQLLESGLRRAEINWTETIITNGSTGAQTEVDTFVGSDPYVYQAICGSSVALCSAIFQGRTFETCYHYSAGCTSTVAQDGTVTTIGSGTASFLYTLPDYFVLIEGAQGAPNMGHFLYATGAVSGRGTPNPGSPLCSNSNSCVDDFFLSSGLNGYPAGGSPSSPGVATGTRAFGPDSALANGAYGSAIYSNGLQIINPTRLTVPSRLVSTDFGQDTSGETSTVSITLGTVKYISSQPGVTVLLTSQSQDFSMGATGGAVASAFSLGSTRSSATGGSVSFASPFESTAVGGNNPALPVGRVGYLVLGNFDPTNGLDGGTAQVVGGATSSQQYAINRLATATGTSAYNPSNSAISASAGYVSGIVENAATGGLAAVQGGSPLTISSNSSLGTLGGSMSLAISNGTSAATSGQLSIGTPTSGSDLGSAFLDESHFAAFVGTGGTPTAAIISSAQASPSLPVIPGTGGLSASPDFLQWGFFFGDFNTTNSGGAVTTAWHAHLVPWVSGSPAQGALPSGQATYSGIVVADVAYEKRLYVTYGTYTNQWNFGSRTGSGNIAIDSGVFGTGSVLPIRTQLSAAGPGYSGVILGQTTNPSSILSSAPAIGTLSGTFAAGNQGSCTSYCGAMGNFSLQTTAPGGSYTATGIFAATKH